MSEDELLAPSADPKTPRIGVRKVTGTNAATCRTRMTVRGHTVVTDEPAERLDRLRRNVEHRCPVMNLFRAADVPVEAEWVAVPAGTGTA